MTRRSAFVAVALVFALATSSARVAAQATGGAAGSADQTVELAACRWGDQLRVTTGRPCTIAVTAEDDSISLTLSRGDRPDVAITCKADASMQAVLTSMTEMHAGRTPAGAGSSPDTRSHCPLGHLMYTRTGSPPSEILWLRTFPEPPTRSNADRFWDHDRITIVLTPVEAAAFIEALRLALAAGG